MLSLSKQSSFGIGGASRSVESNLSYNVFIINVCIYVYIYIVEVDEALGNKANVEIKNVQMT